MTQARPTQRVPTRHGPPPGPCARQWLVAALVGLTSVSPSRAELKQGDVIVFAGDSLTEKGCEPDGYVTLVGKDLDKRFNRLSLQVQGAGQGWDTVGKLRERFDGHVLDRRPTIVVIQIGGNDVGRALDNAGGATAKEVFRLGLEDLIWRTRRAGARPILCTIHVMGERTDGKNRYDALIEEFCEVQRQVAAAKNCQLIELRKPFLEYLRAKNPTNLESGVLTTDGAHLNAVGNRFLADLMIQGLVEGSPPPPVAKEIGAAAETPPAPKP
jgi:lysophospholipase L1-like esterase